MSSDPNKRIAPLQPAKDEVKKWIRWLGRSWCGCWPQRWIDAGGDTFPDKINLITPTPILPDGHDLNHGKEVKMHTFRAQLTFSYKPAEECNIMKLIGQFLFDYLACISFVPFQEDKGQLVSDNTRQQPWVLFAIQSQSWDFLTPGLPSKALLAISSNGFVPLYGLYKVQNIHWSPQISLSLASSDISFPLTSRTIKVPFSDEKPNRYGFKAIVVETYTKDAAQVVEKFYSMDSPLQAKLKYP